MSDGRGCDDCRRWVNQFDNGDLQKGPDCASSFRTVNAYFHASLLICPRCKQVWLQGYHEDFTNSDPLDEWGERTWIMRPLSSGHLAAIRAAAGTKCLDLDTFAVPEDLEGQ